MYQGWLLVEEGVGFRHFSAQLSSPAGSEVPEAFRDYVTECFRQDGDCWLVFSIGTLTRTPGFLNAARH